MHVCTCMCENISNEVNVCPKLEGESVLEVFR